MKKGDVINGFRILEDFKVAGGMSKISFAEKGGKEYFIKEFLSPKYPTLDAPGSEKIKEQKRKACKAFEKHHQKINKLIAEKVSLGGNLVYAVAFFRNGTSYYKVNERIDTSSFSIDEICHLPIEKTFIIARSVCKSLGILHEIGIVHGDLKPDNILIKRTSEKIFTGKLIDFDDSYFSENPPRDREAIVGTPEYYSPELATYIVDEDDEVSGTTLTLASDIFTLGIIFCEYFTGAKPQVKSSEPIWEAIKNGESISFAKKLPLEIEKLLLSMMSLNSSERPSIKRILNNLRNIKATAPEPTKPIFKGGLKGKGLKIATGKSKTETELRVGTVTEKTGCLRGKGLKLK